MPSIRIKNAHHPHLRDLFHIPRTEEDDPTAATEGEFSGGPEPMRPISMPNLKQVQKRRDSPPISLSPMEPSSTRRRPRSNTASSKIHTHVLDRRSRDSRFFRESDGQGSSSTEVLQATLHVPTLVRVEGSQADIFVDAEGGSSGHGIIEESINDGHPPISPRMTVKAYYGPNHHDDIVEHLDVVDPQVGTVSNLTNAANSILLPPTGFYSRKPSIVLSSRRRQKPEGDYDDPLDRHFDDVLKSPSKMRRTLLGVWSFLKTPMGILTGIYGFLVVFWGAAIVFFLGKLINLHDPDLQGFWVEVSSQIVCGLFTVTGVGFIPSRVLSTYRIYKIWHYKRETWRRRKEAGLPQLFDPDDLPDPSYDPNFAHVLTEEEHTDLHRQQIKFAYHQTWYRAHGTETHRAFPISMALWICFLNDGNSIFQCILCGTMWGMNRFQRPGWSTGILIPAGFLCGIGSAVLIWRGGERTKRLEEVRERLKAVLAQETLLTTSPMPEPQSPRFPTKFATQAPPESWSEGPPDIIIHAEVDEEMAIPRTIS